MTEKDEQRMVNCVKLGKELPGLSSPPRNDDLGEKIYENVSAQAWQLWLDQQTILINHYGLNLVDPKSHEFLSQQMEEFFFGEGAKMPDDWVPEGEGGDGGSGGDGGGGGDSGGGPGQSEKGGGPSKEAPSGGGKGAPAPAQK